MAINLIAYFRNKGVPATGLSPIIEVWVIDGNKIIDGDSMVEIAGGFYTYEFTSYNKLYDYVIRCDGGSGLNDGDRYVASSNQLDVNVAGGGLGLSGDIIWDLKKISDNMTTLATFKKEIDNLKKEFKKIKLPKQDATFFKDLKKYITDLNISTIDSFNVQISTILTEVNSLISNMESKYVNELNARDLELVNNLSQFQQSITELYSELQSKDTIMSNIIDSCNNIGSQSVSSFTKLNEELNNLKQYNETRITEVSSKFSKDLDKIKQNLTRDNKQVISKFSEEIKKTTDNLNNLNNQLNNTKKELNTKITESIVSKDKFEQLNQIQDNLNKVNEDVNSKIEQVKLDLTKSNTDVMGMLIEDLKKSDESLKKELNEATKSNYEIILDNLDILKQINETKASSDNVNFEKLRELSEIRTELKQTKTELNKQIKSENKSKEIINQLKQEIFELESKMKKNIDLAFRKVKRNQESNDLMNQLNMLEVKEDE